MFRSSLLRKFAANFLLAAMTVNLFSVTAANAASEFLAVDASDDVAVVLTEEVVTDVSITGYTDPSLVTVTIDWGDGSPLETVSFVDEGTRLYVAAPHTYLAPAEELPYSVNVYANDGAGEPVVDVFTVTVYPIWPNLSITDITFSDATATDWMSMTFTVFNHLTGTYGDLYGTFQEDAVFDSSTLFTTSRDGSAPEEYSLSDFDDVQTLEAEASVSVLFSEIQTYLPGQVLTVCMDENTVGVGTVEEHDENDNCLTVTVPEVTSASTDLPDLQIDSIVYDSVNGDFDVTVSNKSTATAEVLEDANLYLGFSYTEDLNNMGGIPADLQIVNKTMSTSGLPIGGTLTTDTSSELGDVLDTSTCTAYVFAAIDNNNYIQEISDALEEGEDNYYRATIDLCPEVAPEPIFAPDLFLSINSFIGDWMLSYTIGNKGEEAVDSGMSTTGVNHFYLNGSVSPFTKAPWRTHPYDFTRYSAVGGSADRVIFPYYYEDFATLEPGVNTITICVDATNVVLEDETIDLSDVADLDNNCDTFAFDWEPTQAPDLVSEVISASATDDVVTYTVGNLSQMGVVDYIGSYTVSVNGVLALDQRWALDADTTYLDAAGSVTRTLSVPLELGDKVEVCMDATDVILVELSEANNCVSFAVTADEVVVDPAAQANLVPSSIQRELGNVLSFIVSNNGLADIDPSLDPSYVVYNNDLVVAEGPLRFAAGDEFLSMGSSSVAQLTLVGSTSDSAYTVCVDYSNNSSFPDGVVAESNEGDNCLTEILATPPTDGGDTGTGTGGTDDADAPTTDTGSTGGSGPRVTGGGLPVGGSDRDSVILSGSDDGSEDVTLTEEEIVVCGTMIFVDVPEDNSDYDSIYRGWCEGIINGKDPLHFAPSDFIKRDEVTKIVSRVFGFVTIPHEDLEKVTEAPYSDVSTDEVLAYYVETMTEEGFFVEEELADEFRPHEDMTYGEIVDFVSEVNGSEVSMEGYEETDSVTRGSFMTFVFSLFE